ncbi:MAG: hypothetical protein ABIQ33_03090 [Caldimonas sp.]
MDGPRRSGPGPGDPRERNRSWRPAPGYLAVALAIVAASLALWATTAPPPPVAIADTPTPPALPVPAHVERAASNPPPAAPMPPSVAATSVPPPSPQVSRTRDPDGDQTPDLADFVNRGERPTMNEVIDRLHGAGVHNGLGAFSPPGTRPPLIGLAVPEGFVLPEGYVRHYQATDDGQRLEAILMFSPDRPFLDSAGRPIAMPKDRVVPPELAPPGLPIRRIVIPAPAEPRK